MIIQVDYRETKLLEHMKSLIEVHPQWKDLSILPMNLPLGDIILGEKKNDVFVPYLLIERKSISDLVSSIKDGRYEEQSYRLNGSEIHNHNIVYLIEGDFNRRFHVKNNQHEKQMVFSAMFSLYYYKGFSVIRTFSLEETAFFICNSAYKLVKGLHESRKCYYQNQELTSPEENVVIVVDQDSSPPASEQNTNPEDTTTEDDSKMVLNIDLEMTPKMESYLLQKKENEAAVVDSSQSTSYVQVVKKVKKENVTPENIGEIMLSQIPGISSITAMAIMKHFGDFSQLMQQIRSNPQCLTDVVYCDGKGKKHKLNKTVLQNLVAYLGI